MYKLDVIFEIERLARILGIDKNVNKTLLNYMNEKLLNCQDVRMEIYITFIMHRLSTKKCHHPISLLDIQMTSSPRYRSFNRMFRTQLGRKIILSKLNHIKHVFVWTGTNTLDEKYVKNILRGNLLFIPSPNYLKYLYHWTISHSMI